MGLLFPKLCWHIVLTPTQHQAWSGYQMYCEDNPESTVLEERNP